MSEQNQNINSFQNSKGLVLDLNTSLVSEDIITYLRNGTIFTHDNTFFVSNEQAPRKVCSVPYPIIGNIKLPDGNWALFLTDDVSSEIGVFSEKDYSYTTKLNADWLDFNRSSLITGNSKENFDGSFSIYWCDARRNVDRELNLSKTAQATYDNTRLAKLITPPTIEIKSRKGGGSLPNGLYSVAIQYSSNNQPFGQIYSLTLPVSVYSHTTPNGALDVRISNIDDDFPTFDLIIIQNNQQTQTAKRIPNLQKSTGNIYISNFEKSEYIPLDIADLPITFQPYFKSDLFAANNQHLFRVGVETVPELNYQLQAFDIEAEYVVWQADENYYEYGENVGYYRDEGYSYQLEWLHKLGMYSSGFHIAGRPAEARDLLPATGEDVYEYDIKQCNVEENIPLWQVENTAGQMIPVTSEDVVCEGKEIGYGKMAYYESRDVYPDNIHQFGQYANTNIRHHKFPNEEIVPRYSVKNGKNYINILGIRFKNISHPKKADGSPDMDWVGWRIVRADRNNNRSVISRGVVTNTRSYYDTQNKTEIMYSNYPLNDLRPDSFLSSTQTFYKNNKEHNFTPVSTYYNDKFNYYSPHTQFERRGIADELIIESEEIAQVQGEFTEVHQHPRHKLLSLFSFWVAAAMGSVEALIISLGKSKYTSESEDDISVTGGVRYRFGQEYNINSVEDLIGLNIPGLIADATKALAVDKIGTFIKDIALILVGLGLKILTFTFFAIQFADQVLDIIYKFLGVTNYTLQYNCHALYNKSSSIRKGFKRRFISTSEYLNSGQVVFKDKTFVNFHREDSVYLELNKPILPPKTIDNSRQTISEFGIGKDITQKTFSQSSLLYVTNKRKNLNQYGRVDSNINYFLTHNNYFHAIPDENVSTYETPILFGGDCYINKTSFQKKHEFFNQNQSNFNHPDETEFNYLQYRNIAYPRFWANFFKFDFSELLSKNMINFTKFSRTVASRHNLDNKGQDKENAFRVDNAYFYLFNNGIIEYFVESDYNLAFREKAKNFDTLHYSKNSASLSEIFRSDRMKYKEEFNIDKTYQATPSNIYSQQQFVDYDPNVHINYSRNRLLYSLPAYQEYKYDNWKYFLAGNSYEFPKSEFGNFISLHRVDGDRLLFLFDRSSPYLTLGRSQLETTNDLTITIGDGGIFAQPPREIQYSEQHYGNAQSKFATVSTPYGIYYPAERQGRFFKFSSNLEEESRKGIHAWAKEYFPIKLTQAFPNFRDADNPVIGVGYVTSVDTTIDVIYISKKDYIPIYDDITYDAPLNKFFKDDKEISLLDADYFYNLSFTLSYSPIINAFVSFHDWHPDWVINTERHFLSVKGTDIYLHNDNPFEYCNYYGKNGIFELGFILNNKFKVETLSSLEYYLECYKYRDRKNKIHILNENFSHLIVDNSEQISGLLTLVPEPENPYARLDYPKQSGNKLGFDIISTKSENKYRVNDLFDITNDRQAEVHLMHHHPNGYTKQINPVAIDVNKSPYERKLFRHYLSQINLIKDVSGDKNFITKINISDENDSPR